MTGNLDSNKYPIYSITMKVQSFVNLKTLITFYSLIAKHFKSFPKFVCCFWYLFYIDSPKKRFVKRLVTEGNQKPEFDHFKPGVMSITTHRTRRMVTFDFFKKTVKLWFPVGSIRCAYEILRKAEEAGLPSKGSLSICYRNEYHMDYVEICDKKLPSYHEFRNWLYAS